MSSKRNSKPQKSRLGQNFLVDDAACRAIVDSLGDVSQSTVIEIGPGHGALTSLLAPRCGRLIALEVDPNLALENRAHFISQPHVTILEADVLSADFASLVAPAESASVIGNLPYYITSDILFKLLDAHTLLHRAVLMVQREVAERLSAAPGTSDYGLLSATTQLYASVDLLFTLPPNAFSPPPEVHSSVIRMHFAPRFVELGLADVGSAKQFQQFLRACFSQKRKTLRNNLRSAGYTQAVLDSLTATGTDMSARAESLGLKEMAGIFHALAAEKH